MSSKRKTTKTLPVTMTEWAKGKLRRITLQVDIIFEEDYKRCKGRIVQRDYVSDPVSQDITGDSETEAYLEYILEEFDTDCEGVYRYNHDYQDEVGSDPEKILREIDPNGEYEFVNELEVGLGDEEAVFVVPSAELGLVTANNLSCYTKSRVVASLKRKKTLPPPPRKKRRTNSGSAKKL